jgi:hypothetical protein
VCGHPIAIRRLPRGFALATVKHLVALSAFDDRNVTPTARALTRTLGRASRPWTSLEEALTRDCAPLRSEWFFAGAKFGWSLRLKRGKRVIVYLTPCAGYFLASFALGERAVRAIREAGLPAVMLSLIEAAPRYAEGRGVRIPVRTAKDVKSIRALAAIKLAS